MLEPLGPEHNEQDYDAWTSSLEHIAATPGFPDGSWPREMTPDENRVDLQRHADDFRARKGFKYTVLDPAGRDVIGCVEGARSLLFRDGLAADSESGHSTLASGEERFRGQA